MTRFQVILPVGNHNVTKNLTGQRMHVAGSEIYQMNRHTNSFQNMCDILEAKIDCLARIINSSKKKKHLKIVYSCVRESVLPDFGRTEPPFLS